MLPLMLRAMVVKPSSLCVLTMWFNKLPSYTIWRHTIHCEPTYYSQKIQIWLRFDRPYFRTSLFIRR